MAMSFYLTLAATFSVGVFVSLALYRLMAGGE